MRQTASVGYFISCFDRRSSITGPLFYVFLYLLRPWTATRSGPTSDAPSSRAAVPPACPRPATAVAATVAATVTAATTTAVRAAQAARTRAAALPARARARRGAGARQCTWRPRRGTLTWSGGSSPRTTALTTRDPGTTRLPSTLPPTWASHNSVMRTHAECAFVTLASLCS